jgi:hypothetical protein
VRVQIDPNPCGIGAPEVERWERPGDGPWAHSGGVRGVAGGAGGLRKRRADPDRHDKVFTGRFNHPPVEVLFDAICRGHGIEHLLTQPRSSTTTGEASNGSIAT